MGSECWDVIVVGGGPAGSAVSALLAQRGYEVLVLEREKFPRYHIGESLVPGILPVLDQLGLGDQIDKFGFVNKNGITLCYNFGEGLAILRDSHARHTIR